MPTTNRKKQKQGRDTAVQGTNDSSVVSKVSAAAQGYFHDIFLQHFVCKVVRRAPLINRGYYVRWRAVDHCIRRFFQVTENCPKRQILSLGAGFDSLYFRLHADEALVRAVVFEVDFPDVARRKTALINSNITLKGMLDAHLPCPGPVHVSSGQYHLLGLDVREESQGWEQCVCLDMNDFYLGLVPEEERCRVEVLEPFDEYEEWHQKCSHYFILTASRGSFTAQALLSHPSVSPLPSKSPSWSPVALSVITIPVCVEGLGMASTLVSPGQVLLTGGSSRGGRGAVARVLLRGQEGWRSVIVEPSVDLGVRLYHTVTSCPGGGAVVYGGRSSPLNPIRGLFKVTLGPCGPPGPLDSEDRGAVKLCVEQMVCTGDQPPPRWRHTATIVSHKGKNFLFVFGGKNESEAVLGDGHFLCLEQQHWTEIPVEGAAPEALHSHSAYSVPCVVVINLITRSSVELSLDTTSVPWPLMLHSFCSELTDSEEPELLLIGGGGNCFSFGTHFNPQPVTVDLTLALG
ncbi:tRNA wybutosine-synthesizing protein 4 isoform X2 [Lates japonicus]|uniref:tRNA wybutosine-synthesizing protein 4 n=1 Tax=Lates japonicus TaxID=270547 RepID=A0AAD3N8Q9_LATJO|nr:tRNA wybutosine-synthesizing protein 4 isoform X2 [Lates japonicus]